MATVALLFMTEPNASAIDLQTMDPAQIKNTVTHIFLITGVLIICLLVLIVLLFISRKRIKNAKRRIETSDALRKIFFDASAGLVYLKDENLNYVFINKATEDFYHKSADEIIGKDDYTLSDYAFAEKRRQSDLAALEKGILVMDEMEWNGRIYRTTKFPVNMPNGKVGVGAYKTDVTEERDREKKQERTLYRHQILADVMNHGFQSNHEQLDYVLHEALEMTESQYGYIYLYDEKRREFTLNSWTMGVMADCAVAEKFSTYQLDRTGIWGEVVRQRKPMIVNDFEWPNPLKKGYPTGHVELKKWMSIPVIIDEKIEAVVGLANKQGDYDDNDVYEMTLLMNGTWNAVERREAQEKLSFERNKYLQTLISIGDGVMVVGKDGKVEMLNYVAEKLTGWSIEDAFGRHYGEIFTLAHEQEGFTVDDPIARVFATDEIHELENHTVLVSRSGEKYFLEDSAAPIKDDSNATVGVVLVFRDVTEKKKQRKEIEYLSFHDSLTGLYNRRFFEEELRRLDTERNLPISIIMGDVNGLKLTNDIFGHTYGDLLLIRLSDVLQKACRADDIIARWGGDEFVVLLPKTALEEAEQITMRIKEEFSKEQMRAMKGSVSIGADTKQAVTENVLDCLNRAEEKMYLVKTLERGQVRSDAIDTIIRTLHENSPRERQHSIIVSELCEALGKALGFSEVEIRKLKHVGYFHDIGKIALDPKLLNKSTDLTSGEWNEIRTHPSIGYRILNYFDETMDLSEIVLYHHECWDGSGYPKGLKGEEIPLLARILSVAEVYERKLNDAESPEQNHKEEAIQMIRENAGKHFDPKIAALFARMMKSTDENHAC
jgi:diguanylate cyclase (GGDEF)-like protein/PAS domain S-box-containing protein